VEKTWFYSGKKNIWVNYNDLTATSLEIMVSKGNHPQMALIQGSEITIYPETWF
jgi:NAD dependent epimerase/dehydratase family enzyme